MIDERFWKWGGTPWEWCQEKGFFAQIADMCHGEDNGPAMRAALSGLIEGYVHRWFEDNAAMRVLQVEGTHEADLVNLDTGRSSRTYSLAGKIDKVVLINGQTCLVDHKTTSLDVSDPASTYWRRLRVDGQGQMYQILLMSQGVEIDRVVWDVARRPTWRMKKLPAAASKLLFETMIYHDHDVSRESLEHVASTGLEDWELLSYRIAAASMEEPNKFFVRTTIPRTKPELVRFNDKLWRIADEMRRSRRLNIEDQIENWGACTMYNTACEYLPLCSGSDTFDSDKWQNVDHVHPELEMEDRDEKSLVTHSRISCFLACRKKHHLKYELGRRKADDTGTEALWFGTAWHHLMDKFWIESQRIQHDESSRHGSPASEAGRPEDGEDEESPQGDLDQD